VKNPALVAQGRAPRAAVQVNGTTINGWSEWSVENSTFASADKFRVHFAASALPPGNDANWFSHQDKIQVAIFAGFPADPAKVSASSLTQLILGNADEVVFDPIARTVEVSGRDLSSKLIDAKISQKYPNKKSSDIATILAGLAGLTPVVTATQVKAGKLYEIDQVRLTDNTTQWDLLQYLAREEGFVAYVTGQELHFEPKPNAGQDPYVFQFTPPTAGAPTFNATSFSGRRNLSLTGGIQVQVNSWNLRDKKAYQKTATSPQGSAKTYTYVFANLTPAQCQARANQILASLAQHEMTIQVRGPADVLLTRTDVIQIKGTGTDFDQVYYPSSITRSFSVDEGFVWDIEAKNNSSD